MKVICKYFWIGLFSLIIAIVVLLFFPKISVIVIAVISSAITLTMTFDFLKLFICIYGKYEERKWKKNSVVNPSQSLYRWTGRNSIEERFLYNLLRKDASISPLNNLNEIKENILNACSNNLANLYLFKSYLDFHERNDLSDKFWPITVGGLITFISTISSKLITANIDKIRVFINNSSSQFNNSYIVSWVNYCTWFLLIITLILFLWTQISEQKRRIQLIKEIVSIAILEKEKKI